VATTVRCSNVRCTVGAEIVIMVERLTVWSKSIEAVTHLGAVSYPFHSFLRGRA
jgi:hypothetical protein